MQRKAATLAAATGGGMKTTRNRTRLGLVAMAMLACGTPLLAVGINGIDGGMPNRISMNVTVPKQTQGATFGEKVNAGLQAAGGAVANGSAIEIACGQDACAVLLPGGQGYRVDTDRMTLQPLAQSHAATLRKGTPAQGASLLGGAMPGGAIVSAAVSSVSTLAGGAGGGAAAASYARTGQASPEPMPLRSATRANGEIDVLDPLVDGDYLLTVVIQKAPSGLKDTFKTQIRAAVTQRVRIEVGFSVDAGVLKTKHDTAKNSVGNIR
ncbi:MAG: hypothetical protein LH470_02585 [Lysobacter sp.]|nr:hypothetical protein [Lysobacter sp.]